PLTLSVYDLAEFLGGPVWSVCLITLIIVLREKIGEKARNRMTVALVAAALAAVSAVAGGMIRTAERQYLAIHTELLGPVRLAPLIAWGTLITGITMAGNHFFGWALILIGWSGWTSREIPRALSVVYLVAGIPALFSYLSPDLEQVPS